MIKYSPKIIAFLFGLAFIFGGVSTISAASDTPMWAFEFTILAPTAVSGVWVTGVEDQVQSYTSLAECQTNESLYASDWSFKQLGHKYSITKSCYQTTDGTLGATRVAALTNTAAANLTDPLDQYNLHCGIPFPTSNTKYSLMDCIPSVAYYALYKPASYALWGAGIVFDKLLSLSIEGDLVAPTFIDSSWVLVRDFSNMGFIFILLYTGIMTMFGAAEWRRVVLQVMFIALLINFSLFFTKIVIDAGNVLAVGIMSSINPGGSISEGLVSSFQPQQFLLTAGNINPLNSTVVFLIAAIVSLSAAFVFFRAAILFSRRLVVFWFLMIVSPFAFLSSALPKGSKFTEWLDTLTSQALIAPVYLFFIYFIMKVISSGNGILTHFNQGSTSWFESLAGPVIVATILLYSMNKALEFTEHMAGSTGESFSKFVAGSIGLAAAAPAIGGAMLGGTIRGVGSGLSAISPKNGVFDKFGKGIQSTGKGVTSASTFIDPFKIPKNLGKITGGGAALAGAAKAAGSQLGIPDVRDMAKGGDKGKEASKAKSKKDKDKKSVQDFIDKLHEDESGAVLKDAGGVDLKPMKKGKTFDDAEVKQAIKDKRESLDRVVANAEALLAQTPNFSPYYAQAVVSKNKTKRELSDFIQSTSKNKDKHNDLKDND